MKFAWTFLRESSVVALAVVVLCSTSRRQAPRASQPEVFSAPISQPPIRAMGCRSAVARDLPPAVIDRAKGLTLQALSSVLLGSQLPAGRGSGNSSPGKKMACAASATIMVNGAKATKRRGRVCQR